MTVFANDSVVLAIEQRKIVSNNYNHKYVKDVLVHRSTDKGLSWSLVSIVPIDITEGSSPIFHVSNVQEQSAGKYSFLVNKSGKDPEHWYSQNYGETWGSTRVKPLPQIS